MKESTNQPKPLLTPVVWCILVTETGERFAYYGFRAILVLYFTMQLDYDENQAIALFAYTTALAYFSPLMGALLADGHWGRYYTILVFGGVYVVGMATLTAAAAMGGKQSVQRFWSMVGLILVCIGTGGIKPCVSSFGADQVGGGGLQQKEVEQEGLLGEDPLENNTTTTSNNDREEQVRAFFSYFYFCINVGSCSSIALIPIIRGHFGFGPSFLVPTLFMITAMGLFFSMRKSYVHHIPGQDGASLSTTFALCWWLIKKNTWSQLPPSVMQALPSLRPGPQPVLSQGSGQPVHDHDSSAGDHPNNDTLLDQQLCDARQALRVLPIMALLPIFWCLYDQQGSVWTLQATKMELNGLQPEQLNVVNPLEIMALIPLFDRCIYPWMTERGFNIQPLRRMSCGMFLAALAFFASGLVETAIEQSATQEVNVLWQLPQITLLSIAEILVSVTGLEFAYATSPDRLKAFLMALFLLTTAVGDLFSGVLYSTVFADLNRATVMHICGVLMLGNLLVFAWVARWWDQQQTQASQLAQSKESLGIELH